MARDRKATRLAHPSPARRTRNPASLTLPLALRRPPRPLLLGVLIILLQSGAQPQVLKLPAHRQSADQAAVASLATQETPRFRSCDIILPENVSLKVSFQFEMRFCALRRALIGATR